MTNPQPASSLGGVPLVSAPPLRKTFAWTLVGNTVYAGCQWGMVACLAKMGTTIAVGQFALAFAITAPVFMLTNLFLRGVQATDARSEFQFCDYFTLRSIGTIAALLAIATALIAGHYDATAALIILLVAMAKAVESFTDIIAGLLQKRERLDQVAISMMWKGVVSLLAFAITYLYSRNLAAASLSLVLSWLTVFLVYDLHLARRAVANYDSFFSWNRDTLLHLARLAAPVGIVTALTSLNFNIPRYFLERYRGASELGVFAALAYAVVVLGLIVNALGQASIVRLSRCFADGRVDLYARLIARMSFIGIGTALAGMLCALLVGRTALRVLYGPEYADDLRLLLLLIGTAGVSSVASFLSFGMTAARRFNAQVPVCAATLLASAIASWTLIPHWGKYGAGLAILASAATQLVGSLVVVVSAVRMAGTPGAPFNQLASATTAELITLEMGIADD